MTHDTDRPLDVLLASVLTTLFHERKHNYLVFHEGKAARSVLMEWCPLAGYACFDSTDLKTSLAGFCNAQGLAVLVCYLPARASGFRVHRPNTEALFTCHADLALTTHARARIARGDLHDR
jgi:hypothetical protein